MLETFSKEKESLSLSELAHLIGVGLPSTTRYIRTLKDLGYLNFDPASKKYSLTPKTLSMGFELLNKMDVRTRLHPYLMSLNREFNVNANLGILDNLDVLVIERIQAEGIVNLNISAGTRLPAYCTSLGRAILAFLDRKQAWKLIERMKFLSLTPYTIIDRRKLLEELDRTLQRGYAFQIQELSMGWANYAAPIFKGKIVEASMGVSFPHEFLKKNQFTDLLLSKLLKVAKEVSV